MHQVQSFIIPFSSAFLHILSYVFELSKPQILLQSHVYWWHHKSQEDQLRGCLLTRFFRVIGLEFAAIDGSPDKIKERSSLRLCSVYFLQWFHSLLLFLHKTATSAPSFLFQFICPHRDVWFSIHMRQHDFFWRENKRAWFFSSSNFYYPHVQGRGVKGASSPLCCLDKLKQVYF